MRIRCLYTDRDVGDAINDFLEEVDEIFDVFEGFDWETDPDPTNPRHVVTKDFELRLTNETYQTPDFIWGVLELTAKTPEAELWLMANLPSFATILEA